MRSVYLIDAYNLLFRGPKNKKSLEENRRNLIEEINEAATRLSLHITLVFDGATEAMPRKAHFENIAIVYTSHNQTADEYIFEEVEMAKKPAFITVVSNDSELTRKCHANKAKIQTLHTFLSFCRKKHKKRCASTRHVQDTPYEIARLLALFEKKLLEDRE